MYFLTSKYALRLLFSIERALMWRWALWRLRPNLATMALFWCVKLTPVTYQGLSCTIKSHSPYIVSTHNTALFKSVFEQYAELLLSWTVSCDCCIRHNIVKEILCRLFKFNCGRIAFLGMNLMHTVIIQFDRNLD